MTKPRAHFDDQVKELSKDLLSMGSVVEEMLNLTTKGLVERNLKHVHDAMAMDDIVDAYNITIEYDCVRLLALQQPMAHDLRSITSILKIITNVERMGDYVSNIAHISERLIQIPEIKPLVDLPKMLNLTKEMLHTVFIAYVDKNIDAINKIVDMDNKVDEYRDKILADVTKIMSEKPDAIIAGIDLILIAHKVERLADHIVNVSERIYYIETGEKLKEKYQEIIAKKHRSEE